jgi:UDP-N-acetylmuramate: L-alanyl-gamma-D-glutamyl-meso-diaminopimelate ligase
MDEADVPVVYFNPHTVEHKKLSPVSAHDVKRAFSNDNIIVFTESQKLKEFLYSTESKPAVFLLMSSGTFDQLDLQELSARLLAEAVK